MNHYYHIAFFMLFHRYVILFNNASDLLDKIKEWLGHSDIKVTMRYAHLNVSSAKTEMADIMDGLIDFG